MEPAGAQWDWLPPEVADQIGQELAKRVFGSPYDVINPTTIQYMRDLRWLCAAFARGLRWYMYICTHRTQPNYVENVTEGLLRRAYAVDMRVEKRLYATEMALFNYAYTAVYNGCTQKERPRLDERFYNTLRTVLARLLREGAIPWREHSENRELRLMAAYYKYLDRYYVKRFALGSVFDMLQETYLANRPTDA